MRGDFLPSEIRDRIVGMKKRGETVRAIAEVITADGFKIHYSTVSKYLTSLETAPSALRPRAPLPRSSPSTASTEADPAPDPEPPEEPIVIPDDLREIARGDWRYYEELKIKLRRRAERELGRDNVKGYELLLRQARAAEERAAELRPPVPPDPDTDPTYRAETRRLVAYLESLVAAVEGGAPMPERTLPPAEPVAA